MAHRLDTLDASQSAALQQLMAITGCELEAAVEQLDASSWDVARATGAMMGDAEPESMPLRPTDTSAPRPRAASGPRTFSANASSPLAAWPWLRRPPFSYVAAPLVIVVGLLGSALGLIARLFGFRPNLPSLSWRGGGSGQAGLPADPHSCAERFERRVEEQTGLAPDQLPSFVIGSYSQALALAKEQLRPLCVMLVSAEHDDTPAFVRSVIADPDLVASLLTNDLVVYGGDVRDRDAYQSAFRCHSIALTLQPRRRSKPQPTRSSRSSRSRRRARQRQA